MKVGRGLYRGLTNYGDLDLARFLRRSFARSIGLSHAMFDRPVIGIAMTPSPLNRGYKALYQRSVLQAPSGYDFDFFVGEQSWPR